jgi:hypothetical protein
MPKTKVEAISAELRPFDEEAFKSGSIDYANHRAGKAGRGKDGGMRANATESYGKSIAQIADECRPFDPGDFGGEGCA